MWTIPNHRSGPFELVEEASNTKRPEIDTAGGDRVKCPDVPAQAHVGFPSGGRWGRLTDGPGTRPVANLSMVQRYAHLSPGHLAAAVEKIVAAPARSASGAVELGFDLDAATPSVPNEEMNNAVSI